jgi:nitronate monooxygenase
MVGRPSPHAARAGVHEMNLQSLLGIELPIIQAPMAGAQGSALAVAVSEAGGLGSLPCAMLGLEALREELAAIRKHTGRPYNVNFFCHTPTSTALGSVPSTTLHFSELDAK